MIFDYLILKPRPKEDGLHDSGYRYISLIGVTFEGKKKVQVQLGQWHDHVLLHGPVNIDITAEGEIRLLPWWSEGDNKAKWVMDGPPFHSSAMVYPQQWETAALLVKELSKIHFRVREEP